MPSADDDDRRKKEPRERRGAVAVGATVAGADAAAAAGVDAMGVKEGAPTAGVVFGGRVGAPAGREAVRPRGVEISASSKPSRKACRGGARPHDH
jgi:hypothetical protein